MAEGERGSGPHLASGAQARTPGSPAPPAVPAGQRPACLQRGWLPASLPPGLGASAARRQRWTGEPRVSAELTHDFLLTLPTPRLGPAGCSAPAPPELSPCRSRAFQPPGRRPRSPPHTRSLSQQPPAAGLCRAATQAGTQAAGGFQKHACREGVTRSHARPTSHGKPAPRGAPPSFPEDGACFPPEQGQLASPAGPRPSMGNTHRGHPATKKQAKGTTLSPLLGDPEVSGGGGQGRGSRAQRAAGGPRKRGPRHSPAAAGKALSTRRLLSTPATPITGSTWCFLNSLLVFAGQEHK